MNKDIEIKAVKDVLIAVVPTVRADDGQEVWAVQIINLKDDAIEQVLINASGKGEVGGVEKVTTTMRYFLGKVDAKTAKRFELILPEAFALTNQFWVSFYEGKDMLDKKFIFPPGSIDVELLTMIPLLNEPGIFLE